VDVDRAPIAVKIARPHQIEQVRACEDLAGVARENVKQIKFARLEFDLARLVLTSG